MSESNSLVKLFNDIMKGMDDDDEKKLQQFTPDGVPAMIARPPMPEEVPMQVTPPMQESAQELKPVEQPVSSIEPPELLRRIPQYESRLDDPKVGIVQPDGRMGTHQMAAEVDPETGMMTAFPMITEMPDGTLKQFENKDEALAYNKSINNVKAFSDPQEGIDYAKGGYKEGTALAPTDQQKFSEQFGDVPLMGEVPVVTKTDEAPEDTGFGLSDLFKSSPPSYANKGFTDTIVSQEFKDKLGELGEWAKENPTEAVAAGLSIIPVVRVGGMLSTGAANVLSKVNMGKLPNRFKNFFVKTKTTKSGKTKVQRPGEPGKYDPIKGTTTSVNVPRVAIAGAPVIYGAGEVGEALFPEREVEVPVVGEPVKVTEDGVPSLIARPPNGEKVEQEVVSSNQAVVDPNNQDAKSSVDAEVDRLLEEGLPRGMMGDDGSLKFEPVDPDKLDPSGDPVKVKETKQGFLSTLWDGVKDVIVNQVKDPANQKALFAYAVSRALGYDGVTLASQVLSNEWKVGAATAKHERELEKLYGKENLAALKKQQENLTIDYSKPVTVFNPDTQENYTVFMTKDKQGFVFDDGGTEPFTVSTLLQSGYSIGEGLDFADQQQLLSDLMEKDAKTYAATITDNFLNPDLEGKERDNVKKALALASEPPVIRAAMTAFTNKYGRGTDFTTAEVKAIASNGINNYLLAVSDGRAKGSKDLIGYMDYEQIKYDITDNGIPSSFFTISGEEDQKIGVNGWSRTNNVVNKVTNNINSRLGKGSYTNTDIYKVLADEFNKKQGDKEFMTFWSKASNNSAEDKAEALSPAMLWVQSITRQDVSPSYKAPSLTEVLDMLAKRKG